MVNWSRIPPKYFQRSVWGVVWTAAVVHGVSTTGEHSKQKKYGILIIGKTGNGKSSIANAILGQQKFAVGSTMASTTLKVQSEQTERDNCLWTVVDTPDPVNSELDTKQLKEEIQKWKQMTASFPSAILLAVRCDVRYTAEEYDIYKKIKNAWADKSFLDNLIIVFTFGDRQDKDLAEELKTVCPELKNVLKDSNNNYVLFNNKVSKEAMEEQVKEFISRIKKSLPPPSPPYTFMTKSYWLYILAFLGIAVASRKQPTRIRLMLLSTPPALFVLLKCYRDA
ncbi:GTPase IMAP family member 4-like [Pomacea canaliculata]|uniref:GTPase IMAP family member 4-like n=1 Tax=Pomacea canaliculata TaxID=400727 RepID=UPI000D7259A9|nr:GTPase IMAP family member 4-like [Pomacea canaliculata]